MDRDEYDRLRPTLKLMTRGKIGNYFPTNKVNKLLHFRDEMS